MSADARPVSLCRYCRLSIVRAKTEAVQWFSLDAKNAWNRGTCESSLRMAHEPITAADKVLARVVGTS